jgi:hypothetical protein
MEMFGGARFLRSQEIFNVTSRKSIEEKSKRTISLFADGQMMIIQLFTRPAFIQSLQPSANQETNNVKKR